MADKRRLLLEVDVDVDSKPLRELGDSAEHAEDGFEDLNQGLKKLDAQFDETAKRAAELRAEISKSGDLALVKDLRKAEADLRKFGKDRKTILGDLGGMGAEAAQEVSLTFAQRLGPLLARVPLGPAGAAVGAALVAGALPIIATGLGAAFIGGAGGAGLAGGIALAARDPRVKSAASDLKTFIGKELEFAARPMVPAVLRSLDTIRKGFGPLRDDLEDIFADSANLLQPLTDGALIGVGRIVDGIKEIVGSADGAGPVFAEIGRAIGTVGDAVGDVLEQLSDNGDEAAGVIRMLGNGIAGAIRFLGDFIEFGTEAFRVMLDIAIGAANVTEAFLGWVPFFGDGITKGRDNLLDIKAAMDRTGYTFAEGALAAIDLGVGIQSVNDSARTAAEGAKLLDQSIRDLIGTQLSMDEANLAVKQGFADLNAALREGQRSLSDNSQAGRDNRKAILEQIGVLEQARQKQIENKVEVGEANRRFNEGVTAIQRNAEKLGFNKQEVNKLIAAYKNIPGDVSTNVRANTAAAVTSVNNFITKLKRLDGTVATTYVKTVSLSDGSYRATSSGGGGRSIEPRAGGGDVNAGQTYLVGEEGRELFTPKVNGYVHDAKTTAAMARSAGPGSAKAGATKPPVYITVNVNGPVTSSIQFEDIVATAFNNARRKGKVDGVST